jgi:hypothetical protein
MERQILLEHLADAERHVADGTRIVEAHRDRIERLEKAATM